MTAPFTVAELRNAFAQMSSPALIRLITEIDDHGPIPPRRLAGTLPDLSPHQLRRATEMARTMGLCRIGPGVGLELTPSGAELADLYDATARWARHNSYPHPICDFTTRVRQTFQLMGQSVLAVTADGSHRPAADQRADENLDRVRAMLYQRLHFEAQAATHVEFEPAA
ncbi:regulator [Streptomyces sp. SID13666]|uniref:regulator n=1 Tax=unclassified Streptomyces TaxID=2593676 RepID=UPI0013BFCB80|nr:MULTISPECIES: regulator [unclassified Streptomyces]MCZ4101312.1 regulator [Streptomyces sp. H39-C1]NEA60198.1 regulator [Streptomyces sp. SID13666]